MRNIINQKKAISTFAKPISVQLFNINTNSFNQMYLFNFMMNLKFSYQNAWMQLLMLQREAILLARAGSFI